MALVSVSSLLASQALGQDGGQTGSSLKVKAEQEASKLKPKAEQVTLQNTAQPVDPKPGAGQPAVPAEMQAWLESSKPGPMHEVLKKNVGSWKGACKSWEPGNPTPTAWECTSFIIPMMEGRYTQTRTRGTMMGMPFEGIGINGYNNVEKRFEGTWIDNFGTGIMFMTGVYDEKAKTITWTGTFKEPMSGQEMTMREVETHVDDNTMRLDFYMSTPGQPEFKNMEIVFTRESRSTPGAPEARPAPAARPAVVRPAAPTAPTAPSALPTPPAPKPASQPDTPPPTPK